MPSGDGIATQSIPCVQPDSLTPLTTATDSPRPKKAAKNSRISLIKRFFRNFNDFDTTYITPNYYDYTVMGQSTTYFQSYKLSGTSADGKHQSLTTRPRPSVKIGPYFGWKMLFLGYALDLTHPRSMGKSSEFSLSLYSAMLGCDFVYVKNDGAFQLRKATGFDGISPKSVRDTPLSGMSAHTLSFSAYYIFNHRHFSYPAAYNQSTVQRKSCGSFMLGGGYSNQRVTFDYTRLPEWLIGTPDNENIIDELKFTNIHYDYYYLSGGYGYNWAFAHNWLLGGSVMPSIGVRKSHGERLRGDDIFIDIAKLSFDCTSRLGIVWCNTNWFAGASFISHLYIYNKDRLSLTNSINYANLYIGFFFHRKKQYRTSEPPHR